ARRYVRVVRIERDVVVAVVVAEVADIVDLDVHDRRTVQRVDMVYDQVEPAPVLDIDGVPAPLAVDKAAVAPDAAVMSRNGIGVEGQLARLVIDDVVDDHLRV